MTSIDTRLGRLPIARPFASSEYVDRTSVTPSDGRMSCLDGFSDRYTYPSDQEGYDRISLPDMNSLGSISSTNKFFKYAGGINTFSKKFSDANGGYPYGAVLDYLNGNVLNKVISLVDNNEYDFVVLGIDDIHWSLCNTGIPLPRGEFIGKLPEQIAPGMIQPIMIFDAPRSGIVEFRGTYETSPYITKRIGGQSEINFGCCLLIKDISTDNKLPEIKLGSWSFVIYLNDWKLCLPLARCGWDGSISVAQKAYFTDKLKPNYSDSDKYFIAYVPTVEKGKRYGICSISGIAYDTQNIPIIHDINMEMYIV